MTPTLSSLPQTTIQLATHRLQSSSNWRPTAYLLIIEERICKTCSHTYEAPCRNPRVELRARNSSARKTISLSELRERTQLATNYALVPSPNMLNDPLPLLERRIERVKVSVASCPQCFSEHTHAQLSLFPRKAPANLPPSEFELLENIKHWQERYEQRGLSLDDYLSGKHDERFTDKAVGRKRKKKSKSTTNAKKPRTFDWQFILQGKS